MSDEQPTACNAVAGGIWGVAIGDALGVPVEFQSRRDLRNDPVAGMRAFGTHRQPAGTWSDDTSLTLCLVESLSRRGLDYADQARRFVRWYNEAHWTPHGVVFDIGNATRSAMQNLSAGVPPVEAGLTSEQSNGNGSLMRVLPLAIYLAYAGPAERIDAAMSCSRLTHGHPRSQIACALYVEIAAALVRGYELSGAIALARRAIDSVLSTRHSAERPHFARLLNGEIGSFPENGVASSGYVIHTLEASLWCLLRNHSFVDSVLAAVNLGDDSDTTGAVAGGLAGLRFGYESIPQAWLATLARSADIASLIEQFQAACAPCWDMDRGPTKLQAARSTDT